MTWAYTRCSCSRWCSWTPPRRFPPARWRSAGSSPRSSSSASSCRCSRIHCSPTGCGAAAGWRSSAQAGGDLRISVVAVNTMLAGAAGALSAMMYVWSRFGKPDPSMMANGMLAGLVAITAPCAFVTSISALIIGLVAGVLVVWAALFVERTLKVDDPVGAVAVHGFNGAWGVLALGLFADGAYGDCWNGVPGTVRGLFYGDARQFVAQSIGTATCIVFTFTVFYAFFKLVDVLMGNRVTADVE